MGITGELLGAKEAGNTQKYYSGQIAVLIFCNKRKEAEGSDF